MPAKLTEQNTFTGSEQDAYNRPAIEEDKSKTNSRKDSVDSAGWERLTEERTAFVYCTEAPSSGGAAAPCDHWSQQVLHLTVCYVQSGVSCRVLSISPLMACSFKP